MVDLAAEEQAIRELSAQWLAAAQARDGDAIDGFFAPDVTTIFDGKVQVGLAAVRVAREEGWAEDPEGEITWVTASVLVAAAGDLAIERGSWTERDYPDADIEFGEFVTVWKKIGGEWKVIYDAGTELDDDDDDGEDEDDD